MPGVDCAAGGRRPGSISTASGTSCAASSLNSARSMRCENASQPPGSEFALRRMDRATTSWSDSPDNPEAAPALLGQRSEPASTTVRSASTSCGSAATSVCPSGEALMATDRRVSKSRSSTSRCSMPSGDSAGGSNARARETPRARRLRTDRRHSSVRSRGQRWRALHSAHRAHSGWPAGGQRHSGSRVSTAAVVTDSCVRSAGSSASDSASSSASDSAT